MHGRDDRNPSRASGLGQREREVEQTVDVDDVGLDGVERLFNRRRDDRRFVCVFKLTGHPVVDDLDDGEAVLDAPLQLPVRPLEVVFGRENRHVTGGGQSPAQLPRVDLGPRAVTRQKVVNGVKHARLAFTRHAAPPATYGGILPGR